MSRRDGIAVAHKTPKHNGAAGSGASRDLPKHDRIAAKMLVDKSRHKRFEGERVPGIKEIAALLRPIKFEAGGEGGNPDLPHGSVGSDYKLGWRIFKNNIERAVLLFCFKVAGLLGIYQALFERFNCLIRVAAKSKFIEHASSLIETGRARFFLGLHSARTYNSEAIQTRMLSVEMEPVAEQIVLIDRLVISH